MKRNNEFTNDGEEFEDYEELEELEDIQDAADCNNIGDDEKLETMEKESIGKSGTKSSTASNTKRLPRISNKQLDVIVEYMETHTKFARNLDLGSCGSMKRKTMWRHLADLVSNYGVQKTVKQCENAWNDLKMRAKEKRLIAIKDHSTTGGKTMPPQLALRDRDMKVLAMISPQTVAGIPGDSYGTSSCGTKSSDCLAPSLSAQLQPPKKHKTYSVIEKSYRSKAQKEIEKSQSMLETPSSVVVRSLHQMEKNNELLEKYLVTLTAAVVGICNHFQQQQAPSPHQEAPSPHQEAPSTHQKARSPHQQAREYGVNNETVDDLIDEPSQSTEFMMHENDGEEETAVEYYLRDSDDENDDDVLMDYLQNN